MSRRLMHIANGSTLAALFAHAFCCGLPALSAIASLVAGVGAAGSSVFHDFAHAIEQWHVHLFVFSTLMLGVAVFASVVAERRDCVTEGHCCHPPCTPAKKRSWRILGISVALYVVNCILFFLEH